MHSKQTSIESRFCQPVKRSSGCKSTVVSQTAKLHQYGRLRETTDMQYYLISTEMIIKKIRHRDRETIRTRRQKVMPSIASHDAIANIRAYSVKADDYDDIVPHHKYPCYAPPLINTQKQLSIDLFSCITLFSTHSQHTCPINRHAQSWHPTPTTPRMAPTRASSPKSPSTPTTVAHTPTAPTLS